MQTFEIFVPSSHSFIVQYHGKPVENYRSLEEEAHQAVEPLIRERWQAYWRRLVIEGVQHLTQQESLDQLMRGAWIPDMYYPCPDHLAEKAIMPGQDLAIVKVS